MPLVEVGFPSGDGKDMSPANTLTFYGPTIWVDIGIDATFDYAKQDGVPKSQAAQLPALIDTGALQSCIDENLAREISLPLIDKQVVAGVNGATEMNVYFAHIYFPAFGFSQWGRFAGVRLSDGGQSHKALIGRTVLENMLMVYDGRTGSVTLAI